jgi:hypothetical protein
MGHFIGSRQDYCGEHSRGYGDAHSLYHRDVHPHADGYTLPCDHTHSEHRNKTAYALAH